MGSAAAEVSARRERKGRFPTLECSSLEQLSYQTAAWDIVSSVVWMGTAAWNSSVAGKGLPLEFALCPEEDCRLE